MPRLDNLAVAVERWRARWHHSRWHHSRVGSTVTRASASLDHVQVVSFDLDDTFWDCAPAIANAERALYEWHAANTPRIADAHTPSSLLDFRAEIRRKYPELNGCVTATRLQGLRDLLKAFGYPEQLANEAFAEFYRVRSQVDLYPDVRELLEHLRQRYRLAAITNGNADLESIGLAPYFDCVLAANLELKAKPHADMFDRCREHFGVQGGQIVHVGDNPVADVLGGLEAGVQTVWFNQHELQWPGPGPGAHFEARSIRQIMELFS